MIKYLWQIIKHKYYLLIQGRKLHVSAKQLIVHDLDKLNWNSSIEFHNSHTPHHWEFWYDGETAHYMPPEYSNEMLADWSATARQQGKLGDVTEWYYSHRDEIKLHPETRRHIEGLGYETGLMLVPYEYWKRVHGKC